MRTTERRTRRRLRRLGGCGGTPRWRPLAGAATASNAAKVILPFAAPALAAALSRGGWPSSLGGLLPPAARIGIGGPSELSKMRREVEDHLGVAPPPPRPSGGGGGGLTDGDGATKERAPDVRGPPLFWEEEAGEGWEVAESTFRVLHDQVTKLTDARKDGDGVNNGDDGCCFYVGFPAVRDPSLVVELARTMRLTSRDLIGSGCGCPPLELEDASVETYPSCPATVLRLSLSPVTRDGHEDGPDLGVDSESRPSASTSSSSIGNGDDASAAAVVSSTENWVASFLSRYKLCPYTASLARAAVGLDSVGVSAGPISVLAVPQSPSPSSAASPALSLLNAFWSSVSLLLNAPEEELSTILLVDARYDNDFASFCRACDDVIEATVQATKSTEFIGRAWFHPKYSADEVGHREVVPGHAVPHSMVGKFVRDQTAGAVAVPDGETLAMANDVVRRTPHATINILRRGQLEAAGRYEASLPAKSRPRANEVYVRNALRLSSKILQEEGGGDDGGGE